MFNCLTLNDASGKKTNFCVVWVLCVLSTLILSGSGENSRFEKPSGVMQSVMETVTHLSEETHGYVVNLVGAKTVEATQQCFFQVVRCVAEATARGLNVVSKYLAPFLRAAGIDVEMPFSSVTPEGVVYISQWVLLALIGYWLLSLAFRLVASTLRRVLGLLKLGVALGLFGLILSDRSVGTETIALRLAGLVCVCVLLGVGTSGTGADKSAHLEEQVRVLERRVKEMERRRKEE